MEALPTAREYSTFSISIAFVYSSLPIINCAAAPKTDDRAGDRGYARRGDDFLSTRREIHLISRLLKSTEIH